MQKINFETFLFKIKGNPKLGPEQSYNSECVQLDKSNLPYFLSLYIYIYLTTMYKLRTQFNINLLKRQLSISYFGCHCHLKI